MTESGPEQNDDSVDPLAVIPTELREVVETFEHEAEGRLAAGYLRSNGIAAELGNDIIPGLPAELSLWVRKQDLDEARRLLDEADRNDLGPRPVE